MKSRYFTLLSLIIACIFIVPTCAEPISTPETLLEEMTDTGG